MEPRPPEGYQEEEIDLYELWLRLKKRWRTVLGTVAVGLILSVLYILTATPVYEGTCVIRTNVVTPKEAVRYVNALNDLIRERKFEELAQRIGLDVSLSRKIVRINAREVRGVSDIVEVNLKATDPRVLGPAARGIVDYMNTNPYVLKRLSLRKKELEFKRESLQKRIKALEETKRIVNTLLREGRSIYFNPAEIDRMIEELRTELIEVESRIALLKGFELSIEPPEPLEPSSPKKAIVLTVSFLSSLLLGVFAALFQEWLHSARKRYGES